jgi:hypothetical protein
MSYVKPTTPDTRRFYQATERSDASRLSSVLRLLSSVL